LQNIQDNYLDYLRKQNDFPVLMLDVTKVDFVEDTYAYKLIKNFLVIDYNKGINQKVL
jgi:hypothetical protein